MPKKVLVYSNQINFLAPSGTQDKLVAIAYFRGSRGRLADPARDFIDSGIRNFEDNLSPADRKRYNEILDNVRVMRNGP